MLAKYLMYIQQINTKNKVYNLDISTSPVFAKYLKWQIQSYLRITQ